MPWQLQTNASRAASGGAAGRTANCARSSGPHGTREARGHERADGGAHCPQLAAAQQQPGHQARGHCKLPVLDAMPPWLGNFQESRLIGLERFQFFVPFNFTFLVLD